LLAAEILSNFGAEDGRRECTEGRVCRLESFEIGPETQWSFPVSSQSLYYTGSAKLKVSDGCWPQS